MITPAAATTKRLFTRVRRTRPTFSANAVYGNEFRTPPSVVARPSARIARAMSVRRIGLPTISPVANTSPVVSTAVMNMTISIETIAATPNVGSAEVERRGDAERLRVADAAEVRRCLTIAATSVPNTRPRSTATRGQEAPAEHALERR